MGYGELFPVLLQSMLLLKWRQIVAVASDFPTLNTLSVARNNIREFSLPLVNQNLRKLDLSFNSVGSVRALKPLQELPELEILILRSNPITDLSAPSQVHFVRVKTLDLTGTCLPDFTSLDPIPLVFPSLSSLQTKDTPLSKASSATFITIARVAKLTELNHSRIAAEERQNAELFYLGTIAKQLEVTTSEAQEKEVLHGHPRWNDLCFEYGPPAQQKRAHNAIDPSTLAARVTDCTFYTSQPVAQQNGPSGGPPKTPQNGVNQVKGTTKSEESHINPSSNARMEKSKLIPRTTSIYALQGIVGRLFSLPPPFSTSLRLIYESNEWDPVAVTQGKDEGWSVSEDEDEDERGGEREQREKKEKGRMVMREEELVAGTKPMGDWITVEKARVRVELTKPSGSGVSG